MSIDKINVLIVCGCLSTEGIGVFLLNMFENIDKNRFDITFAVACKYEQTFEKRIVENGGKVIKTYDLSEGFFGIIKHFFALRKTVTGNRYEIVHSHMDFLNGINLMAAFFGGTKKRISHAHVSKKTNLSILHKIYRSVMRALINIFATKKIGCSPEANKNVNNGGEVIFNGIDLNKFAKQTHYFPKDILLNKEYLNLVTVGRMDLVKNPIFTLQMLESLRKYNSKFRFYWIGSGSMYPEVLKKTAAFGLQDYIVFLNNRSDVDKILSSMDLFIFPSLYEGLGIALIEAQASGLKCLVSDSVPKDVNVGLCFFLKLQLGPDYWAREILNIYKDKSKIDVSESLKQFDIKNTVKELEKIYNE